MLHLAPGKENGNQALYYRTATSPTADLTSLFTLEPFEGGYCLRNVDHDGLLLQTEMNAPWNFRTHDQPRGISWARFLMRTTGGAWTIENGTYPGNWLGLWTPANGYADGEELACNKQGDEVGHFQIFAIPRATFHHQLLEGTSPEEPRDATVLIQNPTFEGNSWVLWDVQGTFGNQRFNGAAETWHSTGFQMKQTLTGLPIGPYKVSCQMANGDGENTGFLFATECGRTAQAVVSQSCVGSDFDSQRNRMAADERYGRLEVDAYVGEDGTLTFGLQEPTNGTTWLVFDNFQLTYYGPVADGIEEVTKRRGDETEEAYSAIFDLAGRRIATPQHHAPIPKGIYIKNGRKIVVR